LILLHRDAAGGFIVQAIVNVNAGKRGPAVDYL